MSHHEKEADDTVSLNAKISISAEDIEYLMQPGVTQVSREGVTVRCSDEVDIVATVVEPPRQLCERCGAVSPAGETPASRSCHGGVHDGNPEHEWTEDTEGSA